MPTSIATAIARRLGADPAETERVLDSLVEDIRHDVARNGRCAVPGLGTFHLFQGTITFEPERAVALAVNHRYAGLEPLLVNAGSLALPEDQPPLHDVIGRTEESPRHSSVPSFEEPDYVPAAAAGGLFTGADVTDNWQTSDAVEEAADESRPLFDVPDWSAASAGAWADPSPDVFDAPAEEPHAAEPDRADFVRDVPHEAPAAPHAEPEIEEEPITGASAGASPDSASQWAGYGEPESSGSDADAPLSGHMAPEPEPEWSPSDAFSRLAQYDVDASTAGPAPDENAWDDQPYTPPTFSEPAATASPFFEAWPDDAGLEPPAPLHPEESPQRETEAYEASGFGSFQEPQGVEPEPVSETPAAEDGLVEEGPPERAWSNERGAQPEEELPAYAAAGAAVYASSVSGASPALPIDAVTEDEETRGTEPIAGRPQAAPVADERKRSAAPWLIAALVLVGLAAAIWLFAGRDRGPLPARDEPVAASDTEPQGQPVLAPPVDSVAQVPPPAPAQVQTEEPAPSDAPPLQRPSIDVSAGGFTLIVASVPSRTTAEAVAQRYRDEGFTTAIFYGNLGGVTRYRVGVGQFPDDGAIERQINDLPSEFPDDVWPMRIRDDMEVYQ